MSKRLLALFLILTTTVFAFGESEVVKTYSADVSEGYTTPYHHPWSTDQVTWTNAAPLPQYQFRTANGTLGNYFYLFGEQINPYANAYNITTGLWEPSTPPPLGNCNWCGVPTNNALYLVGRYYGSYGNEVQKFVPTGGGPTGTWSQVAPYPLAMCGIGAAWDGGDLIYAAGGSTSPVTAYKYSISANTWTPIANIPGSMSYCGAWYAGGKFLVYGSTNAAYASTLLMYDPVSNTWSTGANVPTAVNFATFSTTGTVDYLFSIGGGGGYDSRPATNAVQIYDPYANAWTLETSLPAANGLNSAGVTVPGEVISAGGYPTTYNCYYGIGFPGGCPPPVYDVEVDLTPYGTPIQIPAGGGTFEFNIALTNNETSLVTCNAWTMVTLPIGSNYGPILLANLNLNASVTVNRDRVQNVPASAPSGNYTYHAYVGIYPDNIWDEDSFPFTKLADGDGGGYVNDWANWGADFGGITATSKIPAKFSLGNAYPNPFNPATAIRYELKNSCNVHLTVYDLTGRLVATLANGWMPEGRHLAQFNAQNLSSGVYFYVIKAGSFSDTKKMVLMK